MKSRTGFWWSVLMLAAVSASAQEAASPDKADSGKIEISVPAWIKRTTFSGILNGEFRWMEHGEITDRSSAPRSNLYLRTLELDLETELASWMAAELVLNSEYLGDPVHAGDEEITVDEATGRLGREGFPLYLVIGKKTQPFGYFENDLLTQPMTQDAYETKPVGLTLGVTGPLELDFSATAYQGPTMMDQLFDSHLFDATRIARAPALSQSVDSFIISASITPVKDSLLLFGALQGEPGRGRRNLSYDAGYNFALPFYKNLVLDGEYIKALAREDYLGFDRSFREGVFSQSLAWRSEIRKRKRFGGRRFKARKSHLESVPLELAVRYESFDDDGLAAAARAWSARDRASAGIRWSFFEGKGATAYVGGEYRHSDYRVSRRLDDLMDDRNEEIYLRLGMVF